MSNVPIAAQRRIKIQSLRRTKPLYKNRMTQYIELADVLHVEQKCCFLKVALAPDAENVGHDYNIASGDFPPGHGKASHPTGTGIT
ncbi:MAG: hypothetical protein HQM09_14550 [Candidatus Riflebacteria bacterium]|nr:hypothetical protein [Candidatus Riflebacteria bacterium]